MTDLIFVGQYTNNTVGATGLTVTVDVDRYSIADGSRTEIITGGSCTEGRNGLYSYRLTGADLATYLYVAVIKTAASAVDQNEIASLGMVVPDVKPSTLATAASVAALNNLSAAQVNAEVDTALADYDAPTKAELDSAVAPLATAASIAALNNLSAAQVNAEVDTALADYDAPTKAELDSAVAPLATAAALATVDSNVDAILVDTGTTLPAQIAALENLTADDVLDEVVEGTITLRQAVRLTMARLFGEASGGGTATIIFRDTEDTTNRIVMTVDGSGNRSSVTLDGA